MPVKPDSVIIVLVEPKSPGNIGMVCRAMKNMGLSRLRIVSGCPHIHPEAEMFAVSAKDLLESAERYVSLSDALADTSISFATTRRTGKYRQELLSPPDVASCILSLNSGLPAIVFGREDHGLTTDEISLCTHQATIASSDLLGSLNLAQAVMVFVYELFKASGSKQEKDSREPASSAELEPMFHQMEETLLKIGFLNPQNPSHLMRSLRRLIFRAEPDSREVAILRGLFSQVDWAADSFKGRKGN